MQFQNLVIYYNWVDTFFWWTISPWGYSPASSPEIRNWPENILFWKLKISKTNHNKKRNMVYIYIHDSKSPIALGISKAKEQRFYCCSSSQGHSEAFNMEQTLTSHCKFNTVPSTCLINWFFFLLLFGFFFFVLASEFSFLLLSSSKLRITCRLEIQDSRQGRT